MTWRIKVHNLQDFNVAITISNGGIAKLLNNERLSMAWREKVPKFAIVNLYSSLTNASCNNLFIIPDGDIGIQMHEHLV
jgi:hypothetical protein